MLGLYCPAGCYRQKQGQETKLSVTHVYEHRCHQTLFPIERTPTGLQDCMRQYRAHLLMHHSGFVDSQEKRRMAESQLRTYGRSAASRKAQADALQQAQSTLGAIHRVIHMSVVLRRYNDDADTARLSHNHDRCERKGMNGHFRPSMFVNARLLQQADDYRLSAFQLITGGDSSPHLSESFLVASEPASSKIPCLCKAGSRHWFPLKLVVDRPAPGPHGIMKSCQRDKRRRKPGFGVIA